MAGPYAKLYAQEKITGKVLDENVLNDYFAKEMPRGRPWMKDGHFTAGRDEYMPIPQPQMNYSYGVYKQNPGY